MAANTLNEVIEQLEKIILESIEKQSTYGYFAVLYQKVTIRVKEKLGTGYFDDDARMEQFDIVFANRYLEAYNQYKNHQLCSKSWQSSFESSEKDNLIVLQHLLLGMNAHINFDLGIAAQITGKIDILALKNDFIKINELLGELLDEVQQDLTKVWRWLRYPLKLAGNLDNLFVNFSMKIARNGAWSFAMELELSRKNQEEIIAIRDQKIADITPMITKSRGVIKLLLRLIRFSEKGDEATKIKRIRNKEFNPAN
ncbi:DUF5995 family protein [Saccharicrinis sp. FJH62]|uniref:DUF5995 family protein n=1 Tax=Saccharicrinis sp. FJH62 TaxID=3344657 RepID=UPI0035D3E477